MSTVPNRWANLKETVVNTSLPARMAPKLVPTTLAQATHTSHTSNASYTPHNKSYKKVQPAPTLDDFPSLTASKPSAPVPETLNFASLSRDWAKKQKEDEVAQKEKAVADAIAARFLQEAREKEQAENQLLRRIRVGVTHIPSQRKPDSDDEKYKEDDVVDDDDSFSDTPDEEYEEEEEEEEEDGWNGRKHRDDLY